MKSPGSSRLRQFVLAAALLLLLCQPAFAEKRVALVLGNSAYQNVARLPNPVNDGAVIAATLKNASFDVVEERHDLTAAETRRALRDFADRARDADIAVVYYAGHGIEVDGTNYLIPVDAKLERDTDVYDEAFSLDRVLLAIEPAKQLRLVILDACRDNPFAKTMKRTLASRAIGRGLAKVEPTSPNTVIAFAAKAGSTASDGTGKNSPFAVALTTSPLFQPHRQNLPLPPPPTRTRRCGVTMSLPCRSVRSLSGTPSSNNIRPGSSPRLPKRTATSWRRKLHR